MNDALKKKLEDLPNDPGVYFHKSADGEIIYVGKAAVLRNRVRQYFQKSRGRDAKTEALVAEIFDTDWMVVESELEALFLEAEMVRRYMPRYNILLRDDKSLSYIRIDYDSDYPTVTTTRQPLDDKARYYGPYFNVTGVREALRILRRIFPFATKKSSGATRESLTYHLGLDPGLESGKTSLGDYRANLRKLMAVIEGKRKKIEGEIEKEMALAAKQQDYESARIYRNQLFALKALGRAVIFSDKEFLDISKDHALGEIVNLLNLPTYPRRIEGYDISHMSGTNVVASMVVFTNGVSDKDEYRKFKTTKDHNNDFYNMHETLTRRLSEKNIKAWGCPDLMLIDGGKGQLDAALRARDEQATALRSFKSEETNDPHSPEFQGLPLEEEGDQTESVDPDAQGQSLSKTEVEEEKRRVELRKCADKIDKIPFIGLAKREEQIVIHKERSNVALDQESLRSLGGYYAESDEFILVNVPHSTNLVKLLQRIRDESHRFAVSYHSTLKRKNSTVSILDTIPGVGPVTRKKLIRQFGSGKGVQEATEAQLAEAIGTKTGKMVWRWLHSQQSS